MYKFKKNKYSKWYHNIINNRLARDLSGYVERHHIIPKSLGGPNNKTNIVRLTAQEHFIVHLLLIRMVQDADVYRMVHAIVRFTLKVTNSNEYELLRKYVSRFSKGKYNHSFGRMWAHMKGTEDIVYIKKEDFNSNLHIKGLPYQRGGFKNYICINNGKEDSMIPRDTDIPFGWVEGRLFVHPREQLVRMSALRHTKEKDEEHSKKLTGRIQIYNVNTKKSKRVHPSEVDTYIKEGWIRKSVPNKASKPIIICGIQYETFVAAAENLKVATGTVAYRTKSSSSKWKDWQLA